MKKKVNGECIFYVRKKINSQENKLTSREKAIKQTHNATRASSVTGIKFRKHLKGSSAFSTHTRHECANTHAIFIKVTLNPSEGTVSILKRSSLELLL